MEPKEQAGRKAAEYVKNGMGVGLGTGTTAEWAIRALAARVKEGQVSDIQCIPTSVATRKLADELGLSIRGLEDVEWVDLTIDGADQSNFMMGKSCLTGGFLEFLRYYWMKGQFIIKSVCLVAHILFILNHLI